MYFEWDIKKRERNLEKHGIDFVNLIDIFSTPYLRLPARNVDEPRERVVSQIDGIVCTVVLTIRDDAIRMISARKASRDERKQYQTFLSRRDPEDEGPY
ncbi:MAG: BrnT family toxin [Rhodobacteraceae bacterium]|nr:MAG: BrnT family toxin [Paracoccaceae bacterium]